MRKRHHSIAVAAGLTLFAMTSSTWLGAAADHSIGNKTIQVVLDDSTGLLSVTDLRDGQVWRQTPGEGQWMIQSVDDAKAKGGTLVVEIKSEKPALALTWTIELGPADDEISCRLSGALDQPMEEDLTFPHPFTAAKSQLMVNEKEGMLVPVEDVALAGGLKPKAFVPDSAEKRLTFTANVLAQKSVMTQCLAPDDARIPSFERNVEGQPRLVQQLLWMPRFKTFGVERAWRYILLNDGGYIAAAKRYRKFALNDGTLKLFADPRKADPKLDKLFGAVNIWLWGTGRSFEVVDDLAKAGIDRAIVSWDPNHFPYIFPSLAKEIDAKGYLLGVYDLYREVYEPGFKGRKFEPAFNRRMLPERADEQWLVWNDPGGPFMRRERVTAFGFRVKNYVLAYPKAVEWATERFAEEIQYYPYSARLIDTLSAQPLLENWNPKLKFTRTGEREGRQAVAQFFLNKKQLVGSENVSAWYLGYGHYIEGALSYDALFKKGNRAGGGGDDAPTDETSERQTDAFSRTLLHHIEPGPAFLEAELGPKYRVPTLELIAHDGVVTCSHWRDSSHRYGEKAWKLRDLQNLLYGDMALWNLDGEEWKAYRDQFIQSYQTISPWFRKVGGAEMLSHRFLTDDRAVQETRFSTGDAMIVNFGEKPFAAEDGTTVPALGHHAYRFEKTAPETDPARERNSWLLRIEAPPAGTQLRSFRSALAASEVNYLIYLPPGYEADMNRQYPVVYWFHGSGGKPQTGGALVSLLDAAIRSGEVSPLIVVLPNGLTQSMYNDSADGKWPIESVIIRELIPHIDKTYRTRASQEGRAIEGFSMGGYGALHLAFKYPDLFCSVTSLSPALLDPSLTARKSAGAYASVLGTVFGGDPGRFQAENPFRLVERNREKIRGRMTVRLILGEADQPWIKDRVQEMKGHLEKLGIAPQFRTIPGIGHNAPGLYEGIGKQEAAFYQAVFSQAHAVLR